MKYSHVLTQFSRAIWAIMPEKFAVIRSFLLLKAAGGDVSPEEIELIRQAQREPIYLEATASEELTDDLLVGEIEAAAPSTTSRSRAGAIAVLPLTGTISHRTSLMSDTSGGTSTEKFSKWLRAAVQDPGVKAIVIDCDSPGGTVDGVPELADEVFKARASKTIIGQVNAMSASAAYYILSQCSEIAVTPSGEVGSIGVFAAHEDISKAADMQGVKVSLVSAGKYKTEGNPFEPLSDDARQAIQSQVNDFYDMFTKAVARGRATTQSQVKSGYGEGRMVLAQQAVKDGMADRISTLDQTLSRLGASGGIQKAAAVAATELRILPVAENEGKEVFVASTMGGEIVTSLPVSAIRVTETPDYRIDLNRRERELELYQ